MSLFSLFSVLRACLAAKKNEHAHIFDSHKKTCQWLNRLTSANVVSLLVSFPPLHESSPGKDLLSLLEGIYKIDPNTLHIACIPTCEVATNTNKNGTGSSYTKSLPINQGIFCGILFLKSQNTPTLMHS